MKKFYFLKLFLTCFVLVLGVAVYAQTAELLVHYTFNETSGTVAADASGNGYDGTIIGTTTWVEGTLGGALQFTGDSGLVIPAPILVTASDSMTSNTGAVALWVKCDVPTSIYTLWWGGDNTTGGGFGNENEMHLHLEQAGSSWTGGEVSFFAIGNPNGFIFSDPAKGTDPAAAPVNPTLVDDNAWHHIAATWGGSLVRLYIDGLKINEGAYTATDYPLTHMFLGQMANRSRNFIGAIDDFRLYSAPLNDIEVSDLYYKITKVDENKITEDLTELAVYPNPAADDITVRFFSNTNSKATVSLVSTTGQVLETVELNAIPNYNKVLFDATKYSPGVYFIDLEVEGRTSHSKLMIR